MSFNLIKCGFTNSHNQCSVTYRNVMCWRKPMKLSPVYLLWRRIWRLKILRVKKRASAVEAQCHLRLSSYLAGPRRRIGTVTRGNANAKSTRTDNGIVNESVEENGVERENAAVAGKGVVHVIDQ